LTTASHPATDNNHLTIFAQINTMPQNVSKAYYAKAKAYAADHATITGKELWQWFPQLSRVQATRIMVAARQAAKLPKDETTESQPAYFEQAEQYAEANKQVTPVQLQQLFPMPRRLAESIVRSVRRAINAKLAKTDAESQKKRQAEAGAARRKREAEAIAYAMANPHEFPSKVAERFCVRSPVVCDAIKAAKRLEEIAANKRRIELAKLRKVNRLMAVVDGELVDPKRVRRVEAIERFVGVRA
jgi:hypothetical protein